MLTFSLVPQIQKIPNSEIEKVKQTQRKLNNEVIVRQRREWYRTYADGEISLEGLEKKAPLVARAIRKREIASLKKS